MPRSSSHDVLPRTHYNMNSSNTYNDPPPLRGGMKKSASLADRLWSGAMEFAETAKEIASGQLGMGGDATSNGGAGAGSMSRPPRGPSSRSQQRRREAAPSSLRANAVDGDGLPTSFVIGHSHHAPPRKSTSAPDLRALAAAHPERFGNGKKVVLSAPPRPASINGMNAFEASIRGRATMSAPPSYDSDSEAPGPAVDWTNGVDEVAIKIVEEIPEMEMLVPRWMLMTSVVLPILLIGPPVAYSCLLFLYYKGDSAYRNAFTATVGLNFTLNLFRRFFDILEHHSRRVEVEAGELGHEDSTIHPDLDSSKWPRLTACLCCCLRWRRAYAIALTHLMYLCFTFASLVFLERLISTTGVPKDYFLWATLGASTAFILFAFAEGVYYIKHETRRIGDPRLGTGFVCIGVFLMAAFLTLIFVTRSRHDNILEKLA